MTSNETLRIQSTEHESSVTKKTKRLSLDWKEAVGLGSTIVFGGVAGAALGFNYFTESIVNFSNSHFYAAPNIYLYDYIIAGVAAGISIGSGMTTLHHRGRRGQETNRE